MKTIANKTIIYVPGFKNPANTKPSRKFLEIQKAYPNDKVLQFTWKADDKAIRIDFQSFLDSNFNGKDNFLFIGSSTGCNILLDVIDYCKTKNLPRPHIVLLNPLFDFHQIRQELPGFGENLKNQIKSINIEKLEDNLIIFAKHDEVINHDLISNEKWDTLAFKNQIEWHSADHSFSDLEFSKFLKPEIDFYARGIENHQFNATN